MRYQIHLKAYNILLDDEEIQDGGLFSSFDQDLMDLVVKKNVKTTPAVEIKYCSIHIVLTNCKTKFENKSKWFLEHIFKKLTLLKSFCRPT
jgi:hypothetical protein